jgi:biotin carboxylase
MRPTVLRAPLVALLLAGCTFNTTVHHLGDAPNVPRTDHALVVATPPRDAILLGTITVRGNRNKTGPACEAEAVDEAKKIGATHVIVRPVETPASRGVRCIADAYYLGPIV